MSKFFTPDQGRAFLTRLCRSFPWAGTHEGYDHWARLFSAVNGRVGLGMVQQAPDFLGTDKSVTKALYDAITAIDPGEQPEGLEFWRNCAVRISDIGKVLENGYLTHDLATGFARQLADGRDEEEIFTEIYTSTPFDRDQARFAVAFLKHRNAVESKSGTTRRSGPR